MTASTSAPLHSMAVVVTDMLSRCILNGGFGCIAIKQSGRHRSVGIESSRGTITRKATSVVPGLRILFP